MAPRRPYRSPATVRRARGVAKRQLNEDPDQVPALSELEQRLRYRAALARSHGPTDYLGRCVASDRKTRSGRSDEVGVVSLFCGADLGCLPFNKAPFVYLSGFEIDGRFEEMHARNYGEGRLHVADALEMSHLQVLAVVRKAERARGVKVRALHVVVTMCCKDASRAAGRPVDTAYYHRCVEWVKRVVKALRAKYAPVTHSWEFTDTPAVREAIFRAFPGLCCTVLLGAPLRSRIPFPPLETRPRHGQRGQAAPLRPGRVRVRRRADPLARQARGSRCAAWRDGRGRLRAPRARSRRAPHQLRLVAEAHPRHGRHGLRVYEQRPLFVRRKRAAARPVQAFYAHGAAVHR